MKETEIIRVRYWAAAKAAAGTPEDLVEVSGPVPLGEVMREVVARHPGTRLPEVIASCSVLLGDQPVGREDPESVLVRPGTSVEFLPPFAGG
ncbi:MoaD/ThiS family protein [Nocardioides pantholopis]|uniref:MoaD/ThiS family protein n=1 Tax=Nocardioides pantholopis TaxID=2483798 RepID=UPI001F1531A1|nr:MoaD/ThiS family protein [Nocardioides pantholopis]